MTTDPITRLNAALEGRYRVESRFSLWTTRRERRSLPIRLAGFTCLARSPPHSPPPTWKD